MRLLELLIGISSTPFYLTSLVILMCVYALLQTHVRTVQACAVKKAYVVILCVSLSCLGICCVDLCCISLCCVDQRCVGLSFVDLCRVGLCWVGVVCCRVVSCTSLSGVVSCCRGLCFVAFVFSELCIRWAFRLRCRVYAVAQVEKIHLLILHTDECKTPAGCNVYRGELYYTKMHWN